MLLCLAWISEQTAIISLCRINWLIFVTEAESVYCAIRTGSLYQTDIVSSIEGLICVTSFRSCSQKHTYLQLFLR